MATIRTGGATLTETPSNFKVSPKIGARDSFLDTMNKTFELGTVGGKNTKMDMWDMATIIDDHSKK